MQNKKKRNLIILSINKGLFNIIMYSTKNIENVLLAELTRTQYDTFMKIIKNSTDLGLSYREIRNVRNSETFRKVFGNKQRIWIPLDIVENTTIRSSDNSEQYKEFTKIYWGKSDTISKYLFDTFANYWNAWRRFGNEQNKKELDKELNLIFQLNPPKMAIFWIKGYLPLNNRIIKIGSHINKLINIVQKSDIEFKRKEKWVNTLQNTLKAFNSRDTDPRLPRDVYIAGRNVPDEDIYDKIIKNDRLYICISRYPADVAAMSTGQGWTSCQDLDKDNWGIIGFDDYNWHVPYDVALGTCVAYLITESNIRKSKERQNVPNKYDKRFEGKSFIPKTSLFPLLSPKARILIKPFYNKNNEIYLSTEGSIVYGTSNNNSWVDTINKYLEERQSSISGEFILPDNLWNELDNDFNGIRVNNGAVVGHFGKNNNSRNFNG